MYYCPAILPLHLSWTGAVSFALKLHSLILQGAKVVFNGSNGGLKRVMVPRKKGTYNLVTIWLLFKVGHLCTSETVSTDRKLIFIVQFYLL